MTIVEDRCSALIKKGTAKIALLRVCASCQWIFKAGKNPSIFNCPKCGFMSYGARYVYGDACYRYQYTQRPWLEEKLTDYWLKLTGEIEAECKKPLKTKFASFEFFNKPLKRRKL